MSIFVTRPMTHDPSPPVALTIAGSDNSAGAGVQADLKTFTALGVYGLTAVTCVVAEVPAEVAAVQGVDLDVIRAQITLSLQTYPVAAIKTGLLHSRGVVELVAELYGELEPNGRPPLVVDPVMVATSGHCLLAPDAVAAYCERLFPLATVVTPNLDEARALLDDVPLGDLEAVREAGCKLAARYGTFFLVKGGHLAGDEAHDFLCTPRGQVENFRSPFVRGIATHGNGVHLFGRGRGGAGTFSGPLVGRGSVRQAVRDDRDCGKLLLAARRPPDLGSATRRAAVTTPAPFMNLLIIGGGGREHALAWKLARSPAVGKLYCAPGNAGTARLGENVPLKITDVEGLLAFALERKVDLTVVGPDDALAAGIVDRFQAASLRIFGPTRAAARLEWSKIYTKEFLLRHGIPGCLGRPLRKQR